jgi:4-alpha-glucanotransferase
MKIHFYLRYRTVLGESLSISINGNGAQPLEYFNAEFWHGTYEVYPAKEKKLRYHYEFTNKNGQKTLEWETDRVLDLTVLQGEHIQVIDYWNPASALENAFSTQPFQNIFFGRPAPKAAKSAAKTQAGLKPVTHIFRAKAPLLQPGETLCLLGHGQALRNWDKTAPILLQPEGPWWTARVDLSDEDFPLAYKYGVWNEEENRLMGFEDGDNRPLYTPAHGGQVVLHDGFARFPAENWRGAGVAIPVFSLRSKKSFGVGEFGDLHGLVDWAKSIGLKLIQLLPINDTTATHTWTDSYPYAAISAFALHPIFLNVEKLAGKKYADILKPYAKKQKELNALPDVDYEAVLQTKWDILRQLYDLQKADWNKDAQWLEYYETHKYWLAPYAAFCWLRDLNGTADFTQWSSHQKYKAAEVDKLLDPKSKSYDTVAIHLFVQYQLHLQLKEATDYAHQNGLVLKGDIPIGIYRYSCDAWVAPELYNMDSQAGAPPDDFAEKGQNWGFPTYNWPRMQQDGFLWWRRRFEQMSLYFDAFRIDHILGFFRIWSIPMDAVEGILGYFSPALPITIQELNARGIGFDYEVWCKPYITDRVLGETFGHDAEFARDHFLTYGHDGHYNLIPEFANQRAVERWFNAQEPTERNARLRDGLYNLISNVIFLDIEGKGNAPDWVGAPRFGFEKISAFHRLPEGLKAPLKELYVDYFFRRQDDFWQKQAMDKLPALKRSTNMLICGEDLGMVPHCVPDVMRDLGFLSLEIQRMPKKSGTRFFHPKDAPYLSVVTPSTHDMSTLRGWWEENRALTQGFYNEILAQTGDAPWFCEPWINKMLVEQHFRSPAMWSIFQLQDLMGIDGALRRGNPNEERINVPANPKHYWRYRMHLTLEELMQSEGFNGALRVMVKESGR